MQQQVSRQIALMTVFTTCAMLVILAVALGIDANTGSALMQAAPLAIVCGVALAFLISDPFSTRS